MNLPGFLQVFPHETVVYPGISPDVPLKKSSRDLLISVSLPYFLLKISPEISFTRFSLFGPRIYRQISCRKCFQIYCYFFLILRHGFFLCDFPKKISNTSSRDLYRILQIFFWVFCTTFLQNISRIFS